MKNLLLNVSLALGSCLLFLLAIEVGLRITGLQKTVPNPPQIYTQDENPNISYKLKPNLENEKAYKATVSTDERGLRLNEREHNTVILGDSIAFGYGVNDNETLASHLGMINVAVPGYQINQQRALYEDYVADLDPDAVMLVFYWNDLGNTEAGILDEDGILQAPNWTPEEDDRTWLERNSAFYIAYKKLLSLRASKKHRDEVREFAEDDYSDSTNPEHLFEYVESLRSFASILPEERYFVIWPDDELHGGSRPALTKAAQDAGFQVIDLYHLFGNSVETHLWDTVHPSAKSLERAAQFITLQMQ